MNSSRLLPGVLFCALFCALLGGCAGAPSKSDLAACQAEAARTLPTDRDPKLLPLVDNCMAAKGWRASKGCLETAMQGTGFCDYAR